MTEINSQQSVLKIDPAYAQDRHAIQYLEQKGEFWKPCPGTIRGYICCGYQIITPSTGCGMYCRYCVLQAYFSHQCQVVYTNIDDLVPELKQKMPSRKGVVRFGTGEFGDSLYNEHRFGVAQRVAEILEPYENVILEFKTKSTNIEPLKSLKYPERSIVAFSMNTPRMIEVMERETASLEQRLVAASRCIDMGFNVSFHFDPMFHYDNWENEYREVVEQIGFAIKDHSRIAWISLGGFRSMPSLKTLLKKEGTHLPLFSGEMVMGDDGKLRYFRPIRAAFYRVMQDAFSKAVPSVTLYLCMESPEIWKDSGMMWRIPNGLVSYLDNRAADILGVKI